MRGGLTDSQPHTHTRVNVVTVTTFVASQCCKYTQPEQQREKFLRSFIFSGFEGRFLPPSLGRRTSFNALFIGRLLDCWILTLFLFFPLWFYFFPAWARIYLHPYQIIRISSALLDIGSTLDSGEPELEPCAFYVSGARLMRSGGVTAVCLIVLSPGQ